MCRPNDVSRLIVLCYLPLLLSIVCIVTSFFAPFWLLFPEHKSHLLPSNIAPGGSNATIYLLNGDEWAEGLWAKCYLDNYRCDWFWKDHFDVQKSFPGWHYVCQLLFLFGLMSLLSTIIVINCYLCCGCCNNRNTRCLSASLGSLLLLTVVLLTSSLAVYGGYVSREKQVFDGSYNPYLGWGFYLGVTGTVAAFISCVILYWDSCHSRHYGYQKARVV